MEWKKNVDTNLGITIILMFSALLIIFSFLIMGYELGWDFGYPKRGSKTVINDKTDNYNEKKMTDEEALIIGNELYEKASKLSFHPNFTVLSNDGEDVKYVKDENGNFVVSDEWGQGIYFKVVEGIDEYKNLFSENLLLNMFSLNNGEYYSSITPSGGRGSNIYYADTVLSVLSVNENEIVFNADSYYYINYEDVLNNVSKDETDCDVKSNVFKLIKDNDVWKVDVFTLAY